MLLLIAKAVASGDSHSISTCVSTAVGSDAAASSTTPDSVVEAGGLFLLEKDLGQDQ